MEALVYDESPLADYLEGGGSPEDITKVSPSTPSPIFAPRGIPNLRDRMRTLRKTARTVTKIADEQFYERFRYVIVASQLLSHEPTIRPDPTADFQFTSNSLSLKGAIITAGLSFSIAWTLHWIRRRRQSVVPVSWTELFAYCFFFTSLLLILSFFAHRQYLKFLRWSAAGAVSNLIQQSRISDGTAAAALGYIQEVEIVAKGYEISSPLPPISRLDERSPTRQCRNLRRILGNTLTSNICQLVNFHTEVQQHIDIVTLQSYHEVYEISMDDYAEAVELAQGGSVRSQESLRDLRYLFSLRNVARRTVLCDLMALRTGSTWQQIQQWRGMLQLIQSLVADFEQSSEELRQTIAVEENHDAELSHSSEAVSPTTSKEGETCTPLKKHSLAQIRRFDVVANGIRSLNAKVHLLREEIQSLTSSGTEECRIASTITKQYEILGADLRSLMVEWERGRNTMFLGVDLEYRPSRPSSGLRSPSSPVSSFGGMTMVEGGPADALRMLNGEDDRRKSSGSTTFDEEVFEAVAIPRKRMSLALSREEKMAKLEEGRKKRATLQEHAENTTNMLRELQMVIKHRPPIRTSSRITSI